MPTFDPPRLLLVEDDVQDAILVDAVLQALEDPPCSFEVVMADCLGRALEELCDRPAAAVLLDLHLPDAQGLEGLNAIASAHPEVPVVVLTGVDDQQLGERALRAGAQDYLVKAADDGRSLHNRIVFAIQRHALASERDLAQELLRERSEQLESAYAELQVVHDLRERLISVVSHELRTPLTPIVGFGEMLEREPGLPDHVRTMVVSILRNARRLQRRIDGLLVLGQSRDGRLSTRREPVTLRALLDATLADLDVTVGDVEVSGPTDVTVVVDPDHLQQILENLLVNGAKHGRAPFTVHTHLADGRLVMAIADQGDGIDPEFVQAMWEPFTQESLAPASGVGLGLAVVRLLADANDIAIAYDATAGGARFVLRLPLEVSRQPVATAPLDTTPAETALDRHKAVVYRANAFLTASMLAHLMPALTGQGSAIVVARPDRVAALAEAVKRSGFDFEKTRSRGAIRIHDASATLALLLDDEGELSVDRARKSLGDLFDGLDAGDHPVRIYGEMVSLLWERGDVDTALRLEELWNVLLEERGGELLCGYAAASAVENPDDAMLRDRISVCHGGVVEEPSTVGPV